MTSNDEIKMIINASDYEFEQFVREADDAMLNRYFGEHSSQLKAYATAKTEINSTGDSLIVVLPGITGSVLEDVSPGGFDVIWPNPLAFAQGRFNAMNLQPDGVTDADPNVKIKATRPVWFAYGKMMVRLRKQFEVAAFAYDWRKKTTDLALELRDFIDDKLSKSKFSQVTLVGHSMGGLVVLDYLALEETRRHAQDKVRRVIALGTPFRGSIDAVFAIASPTESKRYAIVEKLNKKNDVHSALLSFPSTYYLLPAPNGLYQDYNPVPEINIYDPQTWADIGVKVNVDHLKAAEEHHEFISLANPRVPFFSVVGAYYNTAIRLQGRLLNSAGAVRDEVNGDGVVSVRSAILPGRPVFFLQEVHSELVLDNKVIQAVMDWVRGKQPTSLYRDQSAVIREDGPMRGGINFTTVDVDMVARKIEEEQFLYHDEVQELFAVR